ncbi:melatonin receptor type 1B-like [Tubulanus polymorphus]|uniref:melatonin receptor type 1B-like n=1 Tax=Tubulanus polymorphus TaxID=672921 RepID=UPI003DA1F901
MDVSDRSDRSAIVGDDFNLFRKQFSERRLRDLYKKLCGFHIKICGKCIVSHHHDHSSSLVDSDVMNLSPENNTSSPALWNISAADSENDADKILSISAAGFLSIVAVKILICSLGCVSNSFMLATFVYSKSLRRSQHGKLLIAVTLSDFTQAAFTMPVSIQAGILGRWPHPYPACTLAAWVSGICINVSYWGMVLVNTETYIAIHYPLKYPVIASNKNVIATLLAVIAAITLYHTVLAIIFGGIYDANYEQCGFLMDPTGEEATPIMDYFFVTYALVLAGFIFNIYAAVSNYIVAQRHIREMARQHTDGNRVAFRYKSRLRSATTLAIMFACFACSHAPLILVRLARLINPEAVPKDMSMLYVWFLYASSFLNEIVYGLRSREVKEVAFKIIRRLAKFFDHVLSIVRCYCDIEKPRSAAKNSGVSTVAIPPKDSVPSPNQKQSVISMASLCSLERVIRLDDSCSMAN